ncbi:hypothetical protein [Micromonospora humida]|uniref:Uncharacterized protein n=1 Tax=Micromonospora humida TaxID=2809018 RepID=A0ABS2IRY0_9ACTN|nr:hypothetical protein [Micromonospora humida]MBM7077092.1 hypothetical protein [Micromonospora humida]
MVLAVAGPAVIAPVAYRLRLVRTAVVFLVLAVVIAVPVLPFAVRVGHDLTPVPRTTPVAPEHCVEYSGGDNRCPGG